MADLLQQETPEQQRRKQQLQEAVRELKRRSQDRIKAYNPTNKDFVVVFDGYRNVFEAKQDTVVPRHLYDRYRDKMVVHQITRENEERVAEENKRRVGAGQKSMDHQERELFDFRTNDPVHIRKYMPALFRGVVKEYGKDDVPDKIEQKPADPRPVFDQIAEEVELGFQEVQPDVEVIKGKPIVEKNPKQKLKSRMSDE